MSYTIPIQVTNGYSDIRCGTGQAPWTSLYGCAVLRFDPIAKQEIWFIRHQSTDRTVSFEFCQAMAQIHGAERVTLVTPNRKG